MSALIAILLPIVLLLAVLLSGPHVRARLYPLLPWAPLILLWPLLDQPQAEVLSLVLLGSVLTVDAAAQPVLWLTLIGWTLAGWFAHQTVSRNRRWFWAGWLGALTGMHLLLLAGDIVSFYVGYAVLSLSAYLLVTHARDAEAWRAGRIYLVMALIGEAAILIGVLAIAGQLGNVNLAVLPEQADLFSQSTARWLLFFGFAVKLGILPLHVWLPLAHPVAPVPASAILSGIIVKAGLLGWLRFVPASLDDPAWIGYLLMTLGFLTAFGGVLLGLTQARLKTLLAYSTISQMGLLLVAFGMMFVLPDQRELLIAVLGVMVLHHGLNKAALFLACGCAPGTSALRLVLFAVPAVALAAAPLTTGFLAKGALKDVIDLAEIWVGVGIVLSVTSTATALLLWKGFQLARADAKAQTRLHPAWPILVVAALLVPWVHAAQVDLGASFTLAKLADSLWPLLLATALLGLYHAAFRGVSVRLPEGDLVVLAERLVAVLGGLRTSVPESGPSQATWPLAELPNRLLRLEGQQRRLAVAGILLLSVGVMLGLLVFVY